MATTTEIRDRAANDLGLLRLGQTLQSQDATRISSAYTEVYAMLKKDGLAAWTSTGDIPAEYVKYVIALVVDNCVNTYGVSDSRYQRLKIEVPGALREIRKLAAKDHASMEDPVDY